MHIGELVNQRSAWSTWPLPLLACLVVRFRPVRGLGYPSLSRDVLGEMSIVPSPLELQSCDIGREARHYAYHLPGAKTEARGPDCSTFGFAIVLRDASGWMWRRANV